MSQCPFQDHNRDAAEMVLRHIPGELAPRQSPWSTAATGAHRSNSTRSGLLGRGWRELMFPGLREELFGCRDQPLHLVQSVGAYPVLSLPIRIVKICIKQ